MPSDTDSWSTRARRWCSKGWKRIKDGFIAICRYLCDCCAWIWSCGKSSVIHCIAMGETAEQRFVVYCETFLKDWDTAWYKPEELRGQQGKFLLIASTKSGRTGDILEEAETEWSNKGYLKDGKEYLMVIISSSLKGKEDNSSDTVHKQHKPSFVWDLTNIIYDEYSQFNKCYKNLCSCTEIENFVTDKFHTPHS